MSCLCDRWDVITHTWSYLTPEELLDSIQDRLWLAGTVVDKTPKFIGLYWSDEVSCHDTQTIAPVLELHFVSQKGSERYALNGIVAGVTHAFTEDNIEQVWLHGTTNPLFFLNIPFGTFAPHLSEVYHSTLGFLPLWEWRCTRSEYAKLIESLHADKVDCYEQRQEAVKPNQQNGEAPTACKHLYGFRERFMVAVKKWLRL